MFEVSVSLKKWTFVLPKEDPHELSPVVEPSVGTPSVGVPKRLGAGAKYPSVQVSYKCYHAFIQ